MTAAPAVAQRHTPPPAAQLRARLIAEAIGTGLLVIAVVGSAIAAQRLSDDTGLQLLVNFNPSRHPARTSHQHDQHRPGPRHDHRSSGRRGRRCRPGQPDVQRAGCLDRHHQPHRAGLWLAEVVATAGLVLTIAALTKSGRSQHHR
jgi:hypothetical protein